MCRLTCTRMCMSHAHVDVHVHMLHVSASILSVGTFTVRSADTSLDKLPTYVSLLESLDVSITQLNSTYLVVLETRSFLLQWS